MLGSHNTMSYLPAVHWWQRWQKRWYRCQEHSIDEQLVSGVRYFDIRLNFINGEWHFVHNKIDFGVEDENIYKLMNQQEERVYIRFIYDVRNKKKKHNSYKFLEHIDYIENKYHNIHVNSKITYWDWHEYATKKAVIEREVHSGVSNTLLDYLIYGTKKCYALTSTVNIEKNYEFLHDDDKVILMDYV